MKYNCNPYRAPFCGRSGTRRCCPVCGKPCPPADRGCCVSRPCCETPQPTPPECPPEECIQPPIESDCDCPPSAECDCRPECEPESSYCAVPWVYAQECSCCEPDRPHPPQEPDCGSATGFIPDASLPEDLPGGLH